VLLYLALVVKTVIKSIIFFLLITQANQVIYFTLSARTKMRNASVSVTLTEL